MQNMYAPMAQAVRSQGRGNDTMLVHMTPGEVGGLQKLAMAGGGSLTINPETGLPEAGFLENLLPTILGVGLAATGVGAPLAAGIVAGGTTLITGDLGKGLMAGLGAYGGASLAGGLGIGSAGQAATAGTTAGTAAGTTAGTAATTTLPGAVPGTIGTQIPSALAQSAAQEAALQGGTTLASGAASGAASATGQTLGQAAVNFGQQGAQQVATKAPGFFSKFGAAAKQGLPGGIAQKAAPMLAGYGVLEPLSRPVDSGMPGMEEEEFSVPEYRRRNVAPRLDPRFPQGEISFFDPMGFEPTGGSVYSSKGMAEGDEVPAPAGGLGATLAAQLPEYTAMFQTSPGPVSGVPFGYGAGQAPSEQIRAQMLAAQQAASTPAVGGEQDFGFKNQPRPSPSMPNFDIGGMYNFSGLDLGSILGGMGYNPVQQDTMGGMGYNPVQQDTMGGVSDLGLTLGDIQEYQSTPGGAQNNRGYMPSLPGISPSPSAPPMMSIESGGFVMPARETAEFGNGSTMAGQNFLSQLGGMPIQGPGDGVSDSIPAMIDGQQPAALADGEVYFPPQTVQAMGGAEQLRSMMKEAEESRKNTGRGAKSNVGLGGMDSFDR